MLPEESCHPGLTRVSTGLTAHIAISEFWYRYLLCHSGSYICKSRGRSTSSGCSFDPPGTRIFLSEAPQQRLRAYERALHHSHNASPLLQGRAHIGLSEAHSSLGHEQEARHHLELAHKVFPRRCEEDTAFPYTHFNISSLLCHEGIMHLNLGHPHSAWESFTRMDQELPRTLVPNRLELTVRQAMTSYKLGDRDQSCDYLEIAVRSALMTGNQLRYDEAYGIYERLLQKWGQEHRVKELGSLFLNA